MQLRTDHETFGLDGQLLSVPAVTTHVRSNERVFGYVLPAWQGEESSMIVCDVQGPQIEREGFLGFEWWRG